MDGNGRFLRGLSTPRASRRASRALAVVLLALTAVAVGGSWEMAKETGVVAASSRLAIAYQEARYLATAMDSVVHEYAIEPDQQDRVLFRNTSEQLVVLLASLQADQDHRGEVTTTLDLTWRSIALAYQLFSLVDAGDDPGTHHLHRYVLDPLMDQITGALTSREKDQERVLGAHLGESREDARLVQLGTPLVFAVGLLLLAVFALVTRNYRRTVEAQALHDVLTELPNRALFHDRANQALRAAERTGRQPEVLVLDLDGFKDVNDTFGHEYGDRLLVAVAKRVASMVRAQDTVARFGGDEFGVLLVDADADSGEQTAQRIIAALNMPFVVDDVTLDLEVSIGIARAEPGQDVLSLIRHADTAMYAAKEQRLGYAHHDASHDRDPVDRLTLLGRLRRALDANEIVLHYQPKIAVDTGQMIGVEALARWQDPVRGLLPPSEFIPVLENTHLIHRFTADVIGQALSHSRTWLDRGVRLPVAVNISTRCLLDPHFPDMLARTLHTTGVPGDLLRVEITETTIMTDPARTTDVLSRVRGLGVKASVDDFGTGYSSMAYLKNLPVDELKVDRSFVGDMTRNESNTVLVQSAIDLGHNLGLTVVAEGVEDARTLDAVERLGCDVAQGFYFAAPMTADQLAEWTPPSTHGGRLASGEPNVALPPPSPQSRH